MATAEARSEQSPLGERFSLDEVIHGLASDLRELRAGKITVDQARVRAELAKQLMNGVRLVINAQKHLEDRAQLVAPERNG
ncbi:MAG: hypothetical protein E5W35_02325 [Mesorhizobium sp.]|nr:MAG: hypothetical protein E5W35_02325 [Mesorhizobium sp.]